MKKLIVNTILIICCFSSLLLSSLAYSIIGIDNFYKSEKYSSDIFIDISEDAWYYNNVASVYEYGLMNGQGQSTFAPLANITLAESITLADRVYSIYYFESVIQFDIYDEEIVWYDPYVRYAIEEGILNHSFMDEDYDTPITRAQFAEILSKSIDSIDFNVINLIDDGAIPDVPINAEYADAVYMLYRAGILTGSDSNGTFNPDSTITRAEAAAIITRIVDPSLRMPVQLFGDY